MSEKSERLTSEEIVRRMTPPQTTDELRAQIEKDMNLETQLGEKEDPSKDPRAQNPYTFAFDWTDSRGKRWQGPFTTHYPTPQDYLSAGVMQARLTASTPKDSLDPLTDEIAFIISRLTFCLDDRPVWFQNPLAIIDGVPLLQAIYSEVMAFEQFFRVHGTTEKSGTKKPRIK